MTTAPGPTGSPHLRDRTAGSQSVSNLELFFDLVYVFAITQLSHLLIEHLTWEGAWHTAFLLVVIWWAWIYTTWMANWFDPASLPVRLVLIFGMLASLVMAAALPTAFGERGGVFAAGYLVLQIGRNGAAFFLLERGSPLKLTFGRILIWSLSTAPLWIAGALVDEGTRPIIWFVALGVDLLGPIARYAVPGLGRSETSDWAIDGGHFAERFQLLLIIALGESIVVTGASAADAGLGAETIGSLAIAFLGSAALWWLYFDAVAEHSTADIAHHEDPGRIARDAYTYLHLPIFAGIILSAIGDELLILHPTHELSLAGAVVTLGGPLLYLIGDSAFRFRMIRSVSRRRVIAIGSLAALSVPAIVLPAAAVAGCILVVLVGLAVWEYNVG